ncbi:MAG TPA: DinB family protein [Acidimicrobiales bacterium]
MGSDKHVREWSTTRVADVLRWQLRDAWAVIEPNVRGLTDEEYFWEPAPGCWGVRRRSEATAPLVWGKGEWVVENSWNPPSPPPFTTIGWRLMHGYDCMNDYFFGRAMRTGEQDWNDIEVPGHAADAVALLADLVARIDGTLREIDDEVLRSPADSDGDDPRPAWAAATFAFLEATHHCAEIGVLRDLYRLRVAG